MSPEAKCTSGSSARAMKVSVDASSAGRSGAGAASGQVGAGGGIGAGVGSETTATRAGSMGRAQPSGSSARVSARTTRGSMTVPGCSGELFPLGEPVVDHAQAELELGGQGLELIEAGPVRPQAAVFQQATVPQHRQAQQARLREQPLDVLGQHILGLRHVLLLCPSQIGFAAVAFKAWGMPRLNGPKPLKLRAIAPYALGPTSSSRRQPRQSSDSAKVAHRNVTVWSPPRR